MKRVLLLAVKYFLGFVLIVYAADWVVWHIRAERQTGLGTMQVDQFLGTPLKGQKEEYDFMGTVQEQCARSIFPHDSNPPCWWLSRHRTQWEK